MRKAVFPQKTFCLFGDQGYPINNLLMCPYRQTANIQPHQLAFNASMKVPRVSVEWGFQKVLAEFAFLDFKKNQKLLLQDIEEYYKVAVGNIYQLP